METKTSTNTNSHSNRISLFTDGQSILKTLGAFATHLMHSSLPEKLLHLIYYRVSQINGCAFCLDMHSKDLLAAGENVQRLLVLDAWRETPFFSKTERAALAWAEAVTQLTGAEVPDEVYKEASSCFTSEQLMDLTLGITAINTYNRFNIAFPPVVGGYKPGMFANKTSRQSNKQS